MSDSTLRPRLPSISRRCAPQVVNREESACLAVLSRASTLCWVAATKSDVWAADRGLKRIDDGSCPRPTSRTRRGCGFRCDNLLGAMPVDRLGDEEELQSAPQAAEARKGSQPAATPATAATAELLRTCVYVRCDKKPSGLQSRMSSSTRSFLEERPSGSGGDTGRAEGGVSNSPGGSSACESGRCRW